MCFNEFLQSSHFGLRFQKRHFICHHLFSFAGHKWWSNGPSDAVADGSACDRFGRFGSGFGLNGWRDIEPLRASSVTAAFKIDLKKGGKRGMGFVSSLLSKLQHATRFMAMWALQLPPQHTVRPAATDGAQLHTPRALEFAEGGTLN